MTRVFAYVAYADADRASKLGWLILGPMPGCHGVYAMLAEWLCDCEPVLWRRA